MKISGRHFIPEKRVTAAIFTRFSRTLNTLKLHAKMQMPCLPICARSRQSHRPIRRIRSTHLTITSFCCFCGGRGTSRKVCMKRIIPKVMNGIVATIWYRALDIAMPATPRVMYGEHRRIANWLVVKLWAPTGTHLH